MKTKELRPKGGNVIEKKWLSLDFQHVGTRLRAGGSEVPQGGSAEIPAASEVRSSSSDSRFRVQGQPAIVKPQRRMGCAALMW
jgi:hypothetical protein